MSSVQLITDSYQNYHRSVYLYILYKIGKDEDAKDLAQDVFLRLMANVATGNNKVLYFLYLPEFGY